MATNSNLIPFPTPDEEYVQLELFAEPVGFDFRRQANLALKRQFGDEPFCMRCNSKNNIQLDHIHPVSLYPHLKYRLDNVQWLCRECNSNKNQMTKDFRRYWVE